MIPRQYPGTRFDSFRFTFNAKPSNAGFVRKRVSHSNIADPVRYCWNVKQKTIVKDIEIGREGEKRDWWR